MGIFDRIFRTKQPKPAVKWPIDFRGPGHHAYPLTGTGFGVVFEDEGETGFFYLTNEDATDIISNAPLYAYGATSQLQPGEEARIVWSEDARKVGIYFHDRFQAVWDLAKRRGACRSALPGSPLAWDDAMTEGLE